MTLGKTNLVSTAHERRFRLDEPGVHVKDNGERSSFVRHLTILAAFVIILAGIKAASSLVGPLLLALFIAIMLYPLAQWLNQKGIPHGLSLAILFLGVLVIGVAITGLLAASLSQLDEKLPGYQASLSAQMESIDSYLRSRGINVTDILSGLKVDINAVARVAGSALTSISAALSSAFLILLLLIFMLIDAPAFSARLGKEVRAEHFLLNRFVSFGSSVQGYLRVRTIDNLFVGIAFGILLIVLHVDFAILWGFLAFFFSYIPTIGLPLAAIPAIILAFVQHGLTEAVIVIIGVIVINAIGDNIITPRLSTKELNLSVSTVFLSFVIWTWLLGVTGALLSLPLTVALQTLFEGYEETRWLGVLMSASRPPSGTKPQ